MIDLTQTSMPKQKIIVMIPAFNEEKTIADVVKGVPRTINGVGVCEVMVMDDHSTDETTKRAREAGAEHVFRHKHNVGLGRNFKKGIEVALRLGADIIVNIDGDGQFDPADIPTIVRPILKQEADMVTCSRFLDEKLTKNMPWAKKWGNRRFTNLISRITGEKFTDTQCGFRAYSREAALRLNLKGKFTYTQEVFIDLVEKGMRIKEVPCKVVYHEKRKSFISGNLRRYGFKSLGIIAKTTRDTRPLTFFGTPAVITFVLGCIGAAYALIYWLIHHATTPVRTLFNVSVFFVIFGVLVGILALVADMMKRINTTQEEILYKIKKAEIDNATIIGKLNGTAAGLEKVNGHEKKESKK